MITIQPYWYELTRRSIDRPQSISLYRVHSKLTDFTCSIDPPSRCITRSFKKLTQHRKCFHGNRRITEIGNISRVYCHWLPVVEWSLCAKTKIRHCAFNYTDYCSVYCAHCDVSSLINIFKMFAQDNSVMIQRYKRYK